jgi:hypothetical protein
MADGMTITSGLLGAAQVGGGPTAEQLRLVQSLAHGYFGLDVDVTTLSPLTAAEFTERVDADDHQRIVDLLVVLEFCRHVDEAEQAARIEEYVQALGVDDPFVVVARDALTEGHERVMTDWARFREAPVVEPGLPGSDAELARTLRALEKCAPGTLGRTYFDFLDSHGIPFPGEPGGGDASLVTHDFSHVIAGYGADGPDELALQAMLVSATGFEHHFSGLVASLALYESGKFEILDIVTKVGALDRAGATDRLAEAFRRGTACTADFSAIDHLARADQPLEAVRAECGVPPLTRAG